MSINVNPVLFWPAKGPDDVLEYSWQPTLDSGDSISSHTATIIDGTVTIDSEGATASKITLWLSGGAPGETSSFAMQAVTAGGRTFDVTAYLDIVDPSNALLVAFLRRFPSFSSVPTSVIIYWIEDAKRTVTESWFKADYEPALLTLAAHNLTLAGYGEASGPMGNLAAMGITNFKSASMSVNFDSETIKRTSGGTYSSTRYGQLFMPYLRRNSGWPRLVGLC